MPRNLAITDDLQKRAEIVADKLKTFIPGCMALEFWPLPILECLLERIDKLEMRLDDLEKKGDH